MGRNTDTCLHAWNEVATPEYSNTESNSVWSAVREMDIPFDLAADDNQLAIGARSGGQQPPNDDNNDHDHDHMSPLTDYSILEPSLC